MTCVAPERLKNPGIPYTVSMDIYSFGWICWEIATGRRPFNARNDVSLVFCIVAESLRESIPADCPKLYAQVIESCWRDESKERPSLSMVKRWLLLVQQGKDVVEDEANVTRLEADKKGILEDLQEESNVVIVEAVPDTNDTSDEDEPIVLQLDSTYVSGF